MATNGSSARQWLAEHGNTAPPEELLRIRNAIATKLDTLPEGHHDEDGLLEALDVMDEWQESKKISLPVTPSQQNSNTPPQALDTSPLIPDLPAEPALSPEEKKNRFQELLKKSHRVQSSNKEPD